MRMPGDVQHKTELTEGFNLKKIGEWGERRRQNGITYQKVVEG